MEIGFMRDDEIAEVAAILQACFHLIADREGFDERQRAFLTGERSSEAAVREEARTRPHLVARENGAVLGMAVINGNRLARLYIAPASHRRGIGRALFEAAEKLIRENGHTQMTVGAWTDNAIAFYKSMGMTVAGETEYEPDLFPDRRVVMLTKPLGS